MNVRLDDGLEEALAGAVSMTLEELGFLFATEAEAGDARSGGGVAMEVGFRGPRTGRLRLELSVDTLPLLAANMLGMEDPPSEALQMDALGEVANVVCGNVLPVVHGPRAVFDLECPRAAGPLPADVTGSRALLLLDVGWVEARLFLDPPPLPGP